jgi:sterol desaturase/sphingolipid hydroxylase (fatty acid hydroxylase superfamily)
MEPFQELFLSHFTCYWLLCGYFTVKDFCFTKGTIVKQSSQLTRIVLKKPTGFQLVKTCINSLLNQLVTYTLLSLCYPSIYSKLPPISLLSIGTSICMIPFWSVLSDFYFYGLHRLIHMIRPLYIAIHSVHHMGNDNSVATSTLDAHVVEHLFVNVGATGVGPLIMALFVVPPHAVLIVWSMLATINGVTGHAGYIFSSIHVLHHIYGNCNFGVFPYYSDQLFGTYRTLESAPGNDVRTTVRNTH